MTLWRILCLVMIVATVAVQASDEWYAAPQRVPNTLNSVVMRTNVTGFAVGESATMMETTNGGLSWNGVPMENAGLLRNHSLNGVAVNNAGDVIAVGNGGRTVVPGDRWGFQVRLVDTTWDIMSVCFAPNGNAVACGRQGTNPVVLLSSNKGVTWTRRELADTNVILTAARMMSPLVGVVLGYRLNGNDAGDGVILRTTDGGETWSVAMNASGLSLVCMVENEGKLYAFGYAGLEHAGYVVSADMGQTWTFVEVEDMTLATGAYTNGKNVFAVGHRFVPDVGGVRTVACQFEIGSNGSTRLTDIAEGWLGTLVATSVANKALMVGDSGVVWSRWMDGARSIPEVRFGYKHVEFGATVGTADTTLYAFVENTSLATRRVRTLEIRDTRGEWELLKNYQGRELQPNEYLDVALRFSPKFAGSHWAFLRAVLDDGREHIVYLSGELAYADENARVVVNKRTYDLGDVNNPYGFAQWLDEICTNTSGEDISIAAIEFEDEDAGAFEVRDVELPVVVAPGESFGCEVFFRPTTRGIYRTLLKITVADTQIRIPITASSRIEGYNDIVDIGNIRKDSFAYKQVWFTTDPYFEPYDVFTLEEPGSPFEVIAGDQIDERTYRLDIEAHSTTPGVFLAGLFGEWGVGGGSIQRVDRRILRVEVQDEVSSVPLPAEAIGLTMAPLPAKNVLAIRCDAITNDALANVVNVRGECVASARFSASATGINATLNVEHLVRGVYTVIVQSGGTSYRRSMVKE